MVRTLIAEDEPKILRDLRDLIPRTNPSFKVVDAVLNGQQALESIAQDLPELLITDIQMPVLTGLELIERVRRDKLPILCVILSSYPDFEYARRAISFGVFDYLLKPVDEVALAELLVKLERAVADPEFQLRRREYACLNADRSEVLAAQLVSNVERYILEHLEENINQQTLAEEFHYVAPYLSRLFKKHCGMSPTEYLTHLRIEKVQRILEGDPSIPLRNIAAVVGVSDPLYLSKLFRKRTGLSISEYRARVLARAEGGRGE